MKDLSMCVCVCLLKTVSSTTSQYSTSLPTQEHKLNAPVGSAVLSHRQDPGLKQSVHRFIALVIRGANNLALLCHQWKKANTI